MRKRLRKFWLWLLGWLKWIARREWRWRGWPRCEGCGRLLQRNNGGQVMKYCNWLCREFRHAPRWDPLRKDGVKG